MEYVIKIYFAVLVVLFFKFNYYSIRFDNYAVKYYRRVRKARYRRFFGTFLTKERSGEFASIDDEEFQRLRKKVTKTFSIAAILFIGGAGFMMISCLFFN